EQLQQADAALTRLYTALRDLPAAPDATGAHTARFLDSMDDDFNTPEALAVLQQLATEVNSARAAHDMPRAAALGAELAALAQVLGVLTVPAEQWFRLAPAAAGRQVSDAEVEAQIAARAAARRSKNWAESDRIRDALAAAGVVLEDKAGGATTWRRA
ncbi:MAG TPA: DALR domain-containing protein, partial [Steroidobacteraceae bacterium]